MVTEVLRCIVYETIRVSNPSGNSDGWKRKVVPSSIGFSEEPGRFASDGVYG